MKKIIIFVALLIILIPILFPEQVKAGTLREAYANLAKLQQDATNTANKKQLTEQEIRDTNAEVTKIYSEIESITLEVSDLEKEIAELENNIDKKDKEIKDLSKYLQVSNGESAYLQYAFGSETLSEFVYRIAVIQELSDYNSKLIETMKIAVEESEQKALELETQKKQLDYKQREYNSKLVSLGRVKEELDDTYTSIEADIAESKILLNYYEKVGCKMDDDLDVCAGALPYNASVKRPVSSGAVTSNFGWRTAPCYGCSSYHRGIDIGIAYGTALYPIANGIVTSINTNVNTPAGMTLTIIYNIKGKYYTTTYAHLSRVVTSVGKVVDVNSVVAYSGNSGTSTTGAHLHFEMTTKARYVSSGLYGIPSSEVYTSYDSFKKYVFDQASMFGFGRAVSYFYGRNV